MPNQAIRAHDLPTTEKRRGVDPVFCGKLSVSVLLAGLVYSHGMPDVNPQKVALDVLYCRESARFIRNKLDEGVPVESVRDFFLSKLQLERFDARGEKLVQELVDAVLELALDPNSAQERLSQ